MMRPFTDVYPIEELLDDLEPDQPFFVDVGGGFGHQALSIKVTYPYTRVILEELPLQLQNVEVGEDVELVAQDFFEEQKIKGIYGLQGLHIMFMFMVILLILLMMSPRGTNLLSASYSTRLPRCGLYKHSSQFGGCHERQVRDSRR